MIDAAVELRTPIQHSHRKLHSFTDAHLGIGETAKRHLERIRQTRRQRWSQLNQLGAERLQPVFDDRQFIGGDLSFRSEFFDLSTFLGGFGL